MTDATDVDVDDKAAQEQQERSLLIWHLTALVHGYNELAFRATTLGEKVYCRLGRDNAVAALEKLGGKMNIAYDPPLLELPIGGAPSIRFTAKDIDLMEAAVAEYRSKP